MPVLTSVCLSSVTLVHPAAVEWQVAGPPRKKGDLTDHNPQSNFGVQIAAKPLQIAVLLL